MPNRRPEKESGGVTLNKYIVKDNFCVCEVDGEGVEKLLNFNETTGILNKQQHRIKELEGKVYNNLAWFLMYKDYNGIALEDNIWSLADVKTHEEEREIVKKYIEIAKKRYKV